MKYSNKLAVNYSKLLKLTVQTQFLWVGNFIANEKMSKLPFNSDIT